MRDSLEKGGKVISAEVVDELSGECFGKLFVWYLCRGFRWVARDLKCDGVVIW